MQQNMIKFYLKFICPQNTGLLAPQTDVSNGNIQSIKALMLANEYEDPLQ
jgi:hypothetical protein